MPSFKRRIKVDFVSTVQLDQGRERTVIAELKKKRKEAAAGKDSSGGGGYGKKKGVNAEEYFQCPLYNITWADPNDH